MKFFINSVAGMYDKNRTNRYGMVIGSNSDLVWVFDMYITHFSENIHS